MPEGRGPSDRTTMAGHTGSMSCRHWPGRGTGASTGTRAGASPGPGSGGDSRGCLLAAAGGRGAGVLLLGAVEAEAGWAAAVRLRGAVVTGQLDLRGASIAWPLLCERCCFDNAVAFVECSVKTISMVDSQLPAFDGTRMRLDGILDLRGSVISDIVRLEQAKVTGQLCLRDARVGTAPGTLAVSASGLAVDGHVGASRLQAR